MIIRKQPILLNGANPQTLTYPECEQSRLDADCYRSTWVDGEIGRMRTLCAGRGTQDLLIDAHPDGSYAFASGDKLTIHTAAGDRVIPMKVSSEARATGDWRTLVQLDGKVVTATDLETGKTTMMWDGSQGSFTHLNSYDGKVYGAVLEKSNIVELDPTTNTSHAVMHVPGVDEFAFSSDGRQLAYTDKNNRVMRLDRDTDAVVRLDNPEVEDSNEPFGGWDRRIRQGLAFTPDGKDVLYCTTSTHWSEERGEWERRGNLYSAATDGSEVRHLLGGCDGRYVSQVFFPGKAA